MRARKPVVALGSTAAGIAVVLGLHPQGGALLAAGLRRAPGAGPATPGRSTSTTTTRPPAAGTPASTTTGPPAAGTPSTTTTRPPAASGAGGASRSTSVPAGSARVRTATGKPIQYGFGVISVRATVRGKRLANVVVARIQVADPTSGQIASQVDPMLRSQALSLQTWRINGVSGATYTSEGYAYSLQSALGKLHFK